MESLKPFVEQLKQRVSIVDVIGRVVPLKPRGKQYWGCCPFHNEKTPSFAVTEDMGIFKCFGCGEGGDVITFLMKKNNLQYMDAVRELANIAGVKMPEFKPRDVEEEKRETSYLETLAAAAKIYADAFMGSPAEDYIKKRGGISADVVKKYMLGYAPKGNIIAQKFGPNGISAGLTRHSDHGGADYDFFRNRLMFPIFNVRGDVIAFSGRSLDGGEPKYINIAETEFFAKRRTLFGLNFALPAMRQCGRVVVVEGQIDAIQMQTHGFPETVAPLGTALTVEHVQILQKYTKELIFCFDGDLAGQKAAARGASLALPHLRAEHSVKFAFMPDGQDPDSLLATTDGHKKMTSIINGAITLSDFMWRTANRNFLIKTENGRIMAGRWLRGEYEKIPDPTLRKEYLLTLKGREWDEWNKYRHTIRPNMKAPDPTTRQSRLVSEIAQKYPDLYEKNFEILGTPDLSAVEDTKMTRDRAEKIIHEIALNAQLQNLMHEHADAELIQQIKDQILDLWN